MRICLVTAFPPSRGGLSEYGFHIARELQRNPFVNLTVLADQLPHGLQELDGFSVERCWDLDDPGSLRKLWREIRGTKPDVVWFNLIFSTFGHNPVAAFCGLTLPLLTRLSGLYTHVTLHHLMEGIDLGDAGVRFPRLYRAAGAVATKILLGATSISVLIPGYRRILMERYGGQHVHFRAHGIFSERPEFPDFAKRNNPCQRILAFGKWGTYKKLESMIEAFHSVAENFPYAKLVIAGGDHPSVPGYVQSVAQHHAGDPQIEFTGYVSEENVPELFRTASVAVIPYSSSSGASGVVHLACAYGVPIISADISDFRDMAEREGLAIDFYQAGSRQDLAVHLIHLLESEAKQRAMAEQNFLAAIRMTMPQIASRYLRTFDLERKTKAMKRIARLRRLPAWFGSRYLFAGQIARSPATSIHPHSFFSAGNLGLTRQNHNGLEGVRGNGVQNTVHANGHSADTSMDSYIPAAGLPSLGIAIARHEQEPHAVIGANDQHLAAAASNHLQASQRPHSGFQFNQTPRLADASPNGHVNGHGENGFHARVGGSEERETIIHHLQQVRMAEESRTDQESSLCDKSDLDVA